MFLDKKFCSIYKTTYLYIEQSERMRSVQHFSPKASLSNTGTTLFRLRSKILRLRTEMPRKAGFRYAQLATEPLSLVRKPG